MDFICLDIQLKVLKHKRRILNVCNRPWNEKRARQCRAVYFSLVQIQMPVWAKSKHAGRGRKKKQEYLLAKKHKNENRDTAMKWRREAPRRKNQLHSGWRSRTAYARTVGGPWNCLSSTTFKRKGQTPAQRVVILRLLCVSAQQPEFVNGNVQQRKSKGFNVKMLLRLRCSCCPRMWAFYSRSQPHSGKRLKSAGETK